MTAIEISEWQRSKLQTITQDLVMEPPTRLRAETPTERHLQCVWYDPCLRPTELVTSQGEPVKVEHPGVWNLEAGPDFLGAVIRVGVDRRRVCGDVEIHLRPVGWTQHRHASDPRYRSVRIHVTYVSPDSTPFPPETVCIPLAPPLSQCAEFSWAGVDVTAYPYAARPEPAPCELALRAWPPDAIECLLESVGIERLRQKADRLRRRASVAGADQALWEELMAALGYKHNKSITRKLAQRVTLADLVAVAGNKVDVAAAILWGTSGLLSSAGPVLSSTARRVWDRWWKYREHWHERSLAVEDWRFDGVRPANRPEIRLRAAAVWALRRPPPSERWLAAAGGGPHQFRKMILEDLTIHDPAEEVRGAILGHSRAVAILLNVAIPFLVACGVPVLEDPAWLNSLPDDVSNSVERTMAHTLLGRDHPPSWRRGALRRQGLIQMFSDFCLNDRSRCADCPFPSWIATQRREMRELFVGACYEDQGPPS